MVMKNYRNKLFQITIKPIEAEHFGTTVLVSTFPLLLKRNRFIGLNMPTGAL